MDDNTREKRADSMYNNAHQLCQEGNHAKGAEIYKELLDEYSDLFHEWNLSLHLGVCYSCLGSFNDAVVYLGRARDLIPKDREGLSYMQALEYLGEASLRLGEQDKALRYLEEAEQYVRFYYGPEWTNNRIHYRVTKGRAYLLLNRHTDAIREFSSVRDLLSNDADRKQYSDVLDFEIGRSYYYSGQFEAAWAVLRRLGHSSLASDYRAEFHFVMMKLCVNVCDFSLAVTHLDSLASVGIPENWRSEAYNYAGRAYYYLGDGPNARRCFEESKRYPSDRDWIAKSNQAFLEELAKAGH